jgi:hypothetical protein
VPRRIAWLAFLIFAIEGIAVMVSLYAGWRAGGAAPAPEYSTSAWRRETVVILSLAAWPLAAFAAIWNAVLGVALRRRTAIQELKRRTDRVRDYRTPRAPQPPQPRD